MKEILSKLLGLSREVDSELCSGFLSTEQTQNLESVKELIDQAINRVERCKMQRETTVAPF